MEVVQIINIFIEMIVGSALVYDIYFKKIPNYLLLTGYAGIAPFMYIKYGIFGVIEAVLTIFLIGAALIVVYIIGGLGAGDVKLLCLIGGYLGLENAIKYTLLVIFIGALTGIVKVLTNYSVRLAKGGIGMRKGKTPIRFSIPIVIGYMIILFSKGGII